MNLDFNIVITGTHVENFNNVRISRHIIRYDNNTSLLRNYYFRQSKTNIIIISQVKGEIIISEKQISTIINKLQLKPQKIILITHVNNKFYKRLVSLNILTSIFKKNSHFKLDNDEEEVSLQKVEELIDGELEPVETWFTIDTDLYRVCACCFSSRCK